MNTQVTAAIATLQRGFERRPRREQCAIAVLVFCVLLALLAALWWPLSQSLERLHYANRLEAERLQRVAALVEQHRQRPSPQHAPASAHPQQWLAALAADRDLVVPDILPAADGRSVELRSEDIGLDAALRWLYVLEVEAGASLIDVTLLPGPAPGRVRFDIHLAQ